MHFPDAGETQNEVIFSISNEESDVFQVVTDVTCLSKHYATVLQNNLHLLNLYMNLIQTLTGAWEMIRRLGTIMP
jgi:hypothetical protein